MPVLLPCCFAALVSACSTASPGNGPVVPPIVSSPSSQVHVGKVVWRDLLTRDVAAARNFYAGLFGWRFQEPSAEAPRYWAVSLNGSPVAGMLDMSSSDLKRSTWIVSFSAGDADLAADSARELGATVTKAATDLPHRGRYAVIRDPQGGFFALLRSSTGDPEDGTDVAAGDWVWTELWTPDAEAALRFYGRLLGYRSEDREARTVHGADGGAADSASAAVRTPFFVLFEGDQPRAGIQQIERDADPYWLPYVAVSDVGATVRRATELGGTVLLAPEQVRNGGAAILLDPTGAPFGIQRWPRDAGGDR